MFNWFAIIIIARLEARLLFRSWAFRIFSLIGLVFIVIFDIALGSTVGDAPHAIRALSGTLPMMNIKLLNIYQGIIIVFLATEFIKRDRKNDSSQVILARSFSNVEYYLGKVSGILLVFGTLNFVTLLPAAIIHAFFSAAPFAPMAYLWYIVIISLPTLVLMLGLSLLLITLLRAQAVVFVLMLGISLVSLILLGHKFYFILDFYAFHQPFMFSDFTGLSNGAELFMVRGSFLMVGLAAIAGSTLLMNRLNQSTLHNYLAGVIALVSLGAGLVMSNNYLRDRYADEEFRTELREISQRVASFPTANMTTCDLKIKAESDRLSGLAAITLVNESGEDLDSLLLTINPGLVVREVKSLTLPIDYLQEQHLIWLKLSSPLKIADSLTVEISYVGRIDNRYAFLDIDDERYYTPVRLFVYTFPKKFGIVSEQCVHLTAETGWYPRSGLNPGQAYPAGAELQFTRYSLEATVPHGLTAVSQGEATMTQAGGQTTWKFSPAQLLPQLSLSAAAYEKRSLEVDSISYSLYTLPGHDYFLEYLNELSDTLPKILQELKTEYELEIGFEYPYDWFNLVEAPIDFYSFNRYWTLAHETVQPGLIYLSEMGTYNGGADFKRMKKGAKRRQERANQADNPIDIQTSYFQTFVRTTILGNERQWRFERQVEDIELNCLILPMFVTYQTFVKSDQWPILNYAFESYFQSLVSVPQNTRGRYWRGLTDIEKGNLALQKMSLAELLDHPLIENDIKSAAMGIKGNYLLALIGSQIDSAQENEWLQKFIGDNLSRTVDDNTLLNYVQSLGGSNLEETVEQWYRNTALPGYWIEDAESYKVLDVDRVRTQIKFKLSNASEIDGLVQIGLKYRRKDTDFNPWYMRGQSQFDFSQMLLMPAGQALEIGYVLDQPVQMLSIETFVSRNLPSVLTIRFRDEKLRDDELAWEGSREIEIDSVYGSGQELLVDNEDDGFNVLAQPRENWLRKTLMTWFGNEGDDEQYVAMRFWNPPGHWLATTNQDFFGTFVHSAYFKKSGKGEANVAWQVELDETGSYDIYYYCTKARTPRWGRRHGKRQREDFGQRIFLVYHENGLDEMPMDLNGVEEGWNLIGTYRLLAGLNEIEMTDETSTSYITADAVKWVKRKK